MKKTSILLGLLAVGFANAQEGRVGVNTESPEATLHIKSIENDKAKGIIIPSQTGDELKNNSANLTAEQDGLISYITAGVTTPEGAASNVHFKGLHRFNHNNTSWTRLEPSGLEKVRQKYPYHLKEEKTGYRLVGTNPAYYTGIGNNAIDFSIRTTPLKRRPNDGSLLEIGAMGDYSIILGQSDDSTTLSTRGLYSVVIGTGKNDSYASGDNSIVIGGGETRYENSIAIAGGIAHNRNSISIGEKSESTGYHSIAIGYGLSSFNDRQIALGSYNYPTDFFTDDDGRGTHWGYDTSNGDGALQYSQEAELFSIGNGSDENTASNAMIILRNGNIGIGLTPTKTAQFTVSRTEVARSAKPKEKLEVNGKILLRPQSATEGGKCENNGTITFSNDGNFYGCANNVWKKLNNN